MQYITPTDAAHAIVEILPSVSDLQEHDITSEFCSYCDVDAYMPLARGSAVDMQKELENWCGERMREVGFSNFSVELGWQSSNYAQLSAFLDKRFTALRVWKSGAYRYLTGQRLYPQFTTILKQKPHNGMINITRADLGGHVRIDTEFFPVNPCIDPKQYHGLYAYDFGSANIKGIKFGYSQAEALLLRNHFGAGTVYKIGSSAKSVGGFWFGKVS